MLSALSCVLLLKFHMLAAFLTGFFRLYFVCTPEILLIQWFSSNGATITWGSCKKASKINWLDYDSD